MKRKGEYMDQEGFNDRDLEEIKQHGLTLEQVNDQIALFKKGAPFANLDRPCTVGDGIKRLSYDVIRQYARIFEEEAGGRALTKFVPASGAATRMFKSLLKVYNTHDRMEYGIIADAAAEKGEEYADALEFIDQLDKFAFYDSLVERLKKDGHDPEALREEGDYTLFLDYVLNARGLDYSEKPKGQILFHRYPDGARTAFEEHLVEAAEYVRDKNGRCRLHFTVSPEHETGFQKLLEDEGPSYEKERSVSFHVNFSLQHPSTDTIAVDIENKPFREADGTILFRPGGHGSLIENLNELSGDIVFIKNVDNVVPDRLKSETYLWKKTLGGYLIFLENKIRRHQELLSADADEAAVSAAREFVTKELSVTLPASFKTAPLERRRQFLTGQLKRPLRVCGMVPSSGEPGGGPFWVRHDDGGQSIQIVESAQIDSGSQEQQDILKGLTHFNPVDIVCSLRDINNDPYDLRKFVDRDAVFISRKSKEGRDLKALEHPGLWNGGMAFWNTVFVEVPLITFNPVKTINDLLRDEHQG